MKIPAQHKQKKLMGDKENVSKHIKMDIQCKKHRQFC